MRPEYAAIAVVTAHSIGVKPMTEDEARRLIATLPAPADFEERSVMYCLYAAAGEDDSAQS